MEQVQGSNKRLLFGILLILVGGLWILKSLDLIPHSITEVMFSWQSVMIILGLVILTNGNATTGWVLIVAGISFLLPDLFDISWRLRRLILPVLMVATGIIMLIRFNRPHKALPEGGIKNINYFDDFVIFGGREIVINSQGLVGGRSTAIFGGSEYDLRTALLSENGAVLDCVTLFGGIGFKIPPDWNVKNEVTTIFGAFTDKRGSVVPDAQNLSKTLIIRGFTAFGGVEVKNF